MKILPQLIFVIILAYTKNAGPRHRTFIGIFAIFLAIYERTKNSLGKSRTLWQEVEEG